MQPVTTQTTEWLEANALKRADAHYKHEFSEAELAELRTSLATLELEQRKDDDVFSAQRSNYNLIRKGRHASMDELLDWIENGTMQRYATLWFVPNHELGTLELYDANGKLVETRLLTDEDQQMSLYGDGDADAAKTAEEQTAPELTSEQTPELEPEISEQL